MFVSFDRENIDSITEGEGEGKGGEEKEDNVFVSDAENHVL